MVNRKANCPACGAEVRFDLRSSLVVICPACRSAVARGDKQPEDLGKVADLAETNSPLSLGLSGKSGLAFTLTGRVQLKHASGALWDEWFLSFIDGRTGWLAEAQGRYFLTFPRALGPEFPPAENLRPGQEVQGLPVKEKLVVNEVNRARFLAAEGELPLRLTPGQEYLFADLTGAEGRFATLDYSTTPPQFFLGNQVTLDQLGLKPLTAAQAQKEKTVEALKAACPQCGGALELRAPDQTERVGCPYCGSLLDARQGALAVFQALKPGRFKPAIPLGSQGELDGVNQTVIGYLKRSCEDEGETFYWDEHLLYHPQTGFRWLVCSADRKWTFVRGVEPGEIQDRGESAQYKDSSYSRTEQYQARVEYVCGEIYWQVTAGELVQVSDFSSGGATLSKESTAAEGKTGEVNWSHGAPISPQDLETRFKLKEPLPRPAGAGISRTAVFFIAGGVLLVLLLWLFSEQTNQGERSGTARVGRTGSTFRGGK